MRKRIGLILTLIVVPALSSCRIGTSKTVNAFNTYALLARLLYLLVKKALSRFATEGMKVFGINTRFALLRPGQYSPVSKIQVDERSASVITQSLSPALV